MCSLLPTKKKISEQRGGVFPGHGFCFNVKKAEERNPMFEKMGFFVDPTQ